MKTDAITLPLQDTALPLYLEICVIDGRGYNEREFFDWLRSHTWPCVCRLDDNEQIKGAALASMRDELRKHRIAQFCTGRLMAGLTEAVAL